MNISHLRYFNKLAELGSYTEAAKALYITQPALSSAMKTLENELGFSLIVKDGRRAKLTDAGTFFSRRVQNILAELDRGIIEGKAKAQAACNPRAVQIGSDSYEQCSIIAQAAQSFRKNVLPENEFNVFRGERQALLRALEQGEVDLIFTMEKSDSESLRFSETIPYRLSACLQDGAPLAAHATLKAKDLRNCDLITYRADSALGSLACSWANQNELHVFADFDDEATLKSMVRANRRTIALVLVPHDDCEGTEGVATVPLDAGTDAFYLFAAYKIGLSPSGPAGLFLDYLSRKNRLR